MNSQAFVHITHNLLKILPIGSSYHSLSCRAVVTTAIQPGKIGRVQFQGTSWRARCAQDIELAPGTVVYVVDRETLTLIVEPLSLDRGR